MATALIMAGGGSARMRSRSGDAHKALLPVCGIPMIDRNVRSLLDSGFTDLHIALSEREPALRAHVENRLIPEVRAQGGTLRIFIERQPLGTIGAAREAPFDDALLVVNVDNLMDFSLRALVAHHLNGSADMTIAAHREPLRLDFGELVVDGDEICEYREKPTRHPLVSSGTYVLGPAAAGAILPGESIGIPALFARLRERGMRTIAFYHDGRWIDVNDRAALERAARLFPETGALHSP